MLVVMCPGCGRKQKTNPRGPINKSVKRCVYCGKSFKIHTHIDTLSRITADSNRMYSFG